jgi:hypothetical protein
MIWLNVLGHEASEEQPAAVAVDDCSIDWVREMADCQKLNKMSIIGGHSGV